VHCASRGKQELLRFSLSRGEERPWAPLHVSTVQAAPCVAITVHGLHAVVVQSHRSICCLPLLSAAGTTTHSPLTQTYCLATAPSARRLEAFPLPGKRLGMYCSQRMLGFTAIGAASLKSHCYCVCMVSISAITPSCGWILAVRRSFKRSLWKCGGCVNPRRACPTSQRPTSVFHQKYHELSLPLSAPNALTSAY